MHCSAEAIRTRTDEGTDTDLERVRVKNHPRSSVNSTQRDIENDGAKTRPGKTGKCHIFNSRVSTVGIDTSIT